MDADLGAMMIQRRDRRQASPVTRWSRFPIKDFGFNRLYGYALCKTLRLESVLVSARKLVY